MTTSFVTSQGFVNVGGYRINVTARLDPENRQHMTALVEKTVKLWLYVAKKIVSGERKAEYIVTPEDAVQNGHFLPLAEERCTVWGDMPSASGFTVHSSYTAQDALDVYWSRQDALKTFAPPATSQQSSNPETPLSSQAGVGAEAPSTPSSAKSAQNPEGTQSDDGVTKVNGKKAAAALPNGSLFEVPIYQVRLRSQDNSKYFEFYTKYGSNLGQYPEMKVYMDNEVALKNGLIENLNALGLTPGKDKMGEWTVKGVVREKDGKKNLYPVSIREAA